MTLPEPPTLPGLPQPPRFPWQPTPPLVPGLAGGVVTAPNQGWCEVEFSNPATNQKVTFRGKPSVVALAEVRAGDIPPVTAPTITVPEVKLPKVSEISRIQRDDFNSADYCKDVATHARDRAQELYAEGKFGLIPWPLDVVFTWILSTFVYWLFYGGMYAVGFILNFLWDRFIQPQVDKVEDEIDKIMVDFRVNVQTSVNKLGSATANSVNQGLSSVIPILYDMMGLVQGQLMTPVNTRNITRSGFEYFALSKGQKTHYLATGPP